MRLELSQGAFFIGAHQSAVASYIDGKNRR